MSNNTIPVIQGTPIQPFEPEYQEMLKYESGSADQDAFQVKGKHKEPWLNVLDAFEPGTQPSIDYAINHPIIGPRIRGKIIDLGAGTCWLAGKVSQLKRIEEVVALDISKKFLTTVGSRIISHFQGDVSKIKFAVSSFNHVPFDAENFDCAFLIAAIHHSLSPIKTLIEIKRILKQDGILIIVEQPCPVLNIRKGREIALQISKNTKATELCYTKGELEYIIRHAGFSKVSFYPVDIEEQKDYPIHILVKKIIKRILNKIIRLFSLEDIVATPTYLIVAEK